MGKVWAFLFFASLNTHIFQTQHKGKNEMAKLTAAWIARTKDTGNYSDGNGLMLVIGKNGNTKTWKFKTRLMVNGKPKNFDKKIGGYPAMSLSDAREVALTIKTAYQNGIDYFADLEITQLQAKKDAITFQTIADEWLSIKQAKGMRANTLDTDKKRLDKHILPTLATTPIKAIDKAMLRQICDRSALEAPYTANRIAGMLQSIFEHAAISETIETSPAQYLTKLYPKPKTTNNPHLSIEEIPELLTALRMGLQFELIDIITYRMILIQFHTLARPAEIATLKWEYIDFDAACWTIPLEKMKNKETHTQPLSPHVVAMLKEQQSYSEGSDYVFPSAKCNGKTPHRNKETANTALKKRLKYKDRLTAHGLRHTAATALGKLGYDRDLIDTALSHLVGNEVSRTYNKDKAIKQRREMLNRWSEYLTNLTDK